MDVFLTGGTGTIGSAILRRLLADGKTVAALARSAASARWLADSGATPIAGDLANPDAWIATAVACRGIIHTGASFGPDMAGEERRFVSLLRRMVPDLPEPPRLVYTGGIWAFPASPDQPISESAAFDPLPAFSHLGELTRSLLTIPRMGVAVIHPALVSAPGRGPLAEMAEAAVSGQPFVTRAQPDTIWPLVDADDLADLYLRALASSQFRLSLIGAGLAGASLSDIAACVAEACGASVAIETAAAPDGDPHHDFAAGYARSQMASSLRAQRMLGWRPVCNSLTALVEVAVGPIPAAPRSSAAQLPVQLPVQAAAAVAVAAPLTEAISAPEMATELSMTAPPLPADADVAPDAWAEDELPPLPLRSRPVGPDVETAGPFSNDLETLATQPEDLEADRLPDLVREVDPDFLAPDADGLIDPLDEQPLDAADVDEPVNASMDDRLPPETKP